MSGFWGKVLAGGELRRAVEAEAGGDYLEAARAYGAVGDHAKVAEMHLLLSERAATPDDKLEALREAARWANGDDDAARRVRRRVAAAQLAWVRARGLITEADRAVVAEAAALFLAADDAAGAGACHELLGAAEAAAEAYQAAGEVDRLEHVLDGEASRRRRAVAVTDAIEEHRLHLRRGDPRAALEALDDAIAAAEAKDRVGLVKMRAALAARRLSDGRLTLVAGATRTIVAAPPLIIGRSETCTLSLRDAGVSRQHARLWVEDGGWRVEDLGSRHGTLLAGVPIAAPLPLPEQGELAIGERCAWSFAIANGQLDAVQTRGLDRGVRLCSGTGALHLVDAAAARIVVRFDAGRARVRGDGCGLFVDGVGAPGEIEPLAGAVLEAGAARWIVAP